MIKEPTVQTALVCVPHLKIIKGNERGNTLSAGEKASPLLGHVLVHIFCGTSSIKDVHKGLNKWLHSRLWIVTTGWPTEQIAQCTEGKKKAVGPLHRAYTKEKTNKIMPWKSNSSKNKLIQTNSCIRVEFPLPGKYKEIIKKIFKLFCKKDCNDS